MKNFYFTYGMNHEDKDGNSLGHCFTAVQAESEGVARQAMYAARGIKWAFSYSEEERRNAVDRWHLKERSLESVTLPHSEDNP